MPVIFILLAISQYTSLTWHILALTGVTVALFSVAISQAWWYWPGGTHNPKRPEGASALQDELVVARQVCGSRATNLDILHASDLHAPIMWLVYVFCICCFFGCIAWHIRQQRAVKNRVIEDTDKVGTRRPLIRFNFRGHRRRHIINIGKLTLLVLFLLCFAYQFYIYAVFQQRKLISMDWSFGQIVAIIVWAPSLVEFLYLERRKSTSCSWLLCVSQWKNLTNTDHLNSGNRGSFKKSLPSRLASCDGRLTYG